MTLLQKSSRFMLPVLAVLAAAGVSSVDAQTPLDIRVINERLNQIETRLRDAQGLPAGEGTATGMPTSPADAGMTSQPLPTDVAGRLQVRILQLERLVETLTGQMETTQFEVSQLRAQVQQMSNDVAYRLAVLEQAAGVSSAVAAVPGGAMPPQQPFMPAPQPGLGQAPSVQQPTQMAGQTSGLSAPMSAFNETGRIEPDLNMPISAPVQAQPQMMSDAPVQTDVANAPAGTVMLAPGETLTAPVEAGPVNQGNTFGVIRTDAEGQALPPAPGAATAPVQLPPQQPAAPPVIAAAPSPGPVAAARIGTAPDPLAAMTALPEGTPQQQYDYAFDILRKADYGRAETALRMFLEANPEDTLAGNAQYWLGETFYVRGDFEQAAVEFLSGYQTYPSGTKAPDNLLKLGLSMARLGQTDGACTALSRLATEYPEANDTIRRRAQTERARLTCS